MDEIAQVAFCAELGVWGSMGGGEGRRDFLFWSVDTGVGFAVGVGVRVSFGFAEDVCRSGWVFHGREVGCAFTRWELMELFDVGVVAEAVGPPAGDEVHAMTLHILQQFPAAVGCASNLGGFFSFVFSSSSLIL